MASDTNTEYTNLPHHWGRMFDQRWWKLTLPKAKPGQGQRYLCWDDTAKVVIPRRLYRTILNRIRRFAAIMPRAAPI